MTVLKVRKALDFYFHCGILLRLDSSIEPLTRNRNLMKKATLLFLLSILSLNFFQNAALSAQVNYETEKGFYELKEYFDHLNGPDYNLLNGRQNNIPYSGTSHPYFHSDQYRPGSLLLNGEAYDSVTINYDIVDQQVVLQVPGHISGQNIKVVLNRELIGHFQIDGLMFLKMSFPETGGSFFQVVSSGDKSCFLLWKKKLIRSTVSGNTSIRYSRQSREIYIQTEGRLQLVNSRSSFTGIFDEAYRKQIKGYLQREKIRFRNASDEMLSDLMDFCAGLKNSD